MTHRHARTFGACFAALGLALTTAPSSDALVRQNGGGLSVTMDELKGDGYTCEDYGNGYWMCTKGKTKWLCPTVGQCARQTQPTTLKPVAPVRPVLRSGFDR